MLFNEPKLLKYTVLPVEPLADVRFSALQRAEIAEIFPHCFITTLPDSFSALQRAEIAEMS